MVDQITTCRVVLDRYNKKYSLYVSRRHQKGPRFRCTHDTIEEIRQVLIDEYGIDAHVTYEEVNFGGHRMPEYYTELVETKGE